MNENATDGIGEPKDRKRIPVPVILIASLYLVVGIGGFVVHFGDPRTPEWIWMEVTELIAVVCGVFLLRARNWARWLAGAWMAFHVVISFGELPQLAIHTLFFVLILWWLFRANSSRFFQNTRPGCPSRSQS
jgi:cbb3-type cytochrome oxidase subunit 3